MQTPSSPRVVLTQVHRPEAPADDRPGAEEALRQRPTKGAGVSNESHFDAYPGDLGEQSRKENKPASSR
jgi:hypothetical protein